MYKSKVTFGTCRLNFSLASYCDQNYYGEDCSINCVPEDFGCNGHYRCRADGAKICLPGWKGPNCDIQISGGEGDCSFYKGTVLTKGVRAYFIFNRGVGNFISDHIKLKCSTSFLRF